MNELYNFVIRGCPLVNPDLIAHSSDYGSRHYHHHVVIITAVPIPISISY